MCLDGNPKQVRKIGQRQKPPASGIRRRFYCKWIKGVAAQESFNGVQAPQRPRRPDPAITIGQVCIIFLQNQQPKAQKENTLSAPWVLHQLFIYPFDSFLWARIQEAISHTISAVHMTGRAHCITLASIESLAATLEPGCPIERSFTTALSRKW